MTTNATAGPEPAGPLWQQFRLWTEGRVLRDDQGRTGYVVCPRTRRQEYEEQTTSLAKTYLVKWDGERLAQPLSRKGVQRFMTSEFLDAPWVCWEVLAAQKAGWKIPNRKTLQWAMRRCRWTPKELLEGGVNNTPVMKVLQQERMDAPATAGARGHQGVLPAEQQARVAKALKQAGGLQTAAKRGAQGGDGGRGGVRGAEGQGIKGRWATGQDVLRVMTKLMKVLGRGGARKAGGTGTTGGKAGSSLADVSGDKAEAAGAEGGRAEAGAGAGTSRGHPQGQGKAGAPGGKLGAGQKGHKGTAIGSGGGSDAAEVVGRVARSVASTEGGRLAAAVAAKTAQRLEALLSAEFGQRGNGEGAGEGAVDVAGLAERVRGLVAAKLGRRVSEKLSGYVGERLGLPVRQPSAGAQVGKLGQPGGEGQPGAKGAAGAAQQAGATVGAGGSVGGQGGASAGGALDQAAAGAVRRLRMSEAARQLAVRVAVRVTAKVEGLPKPKAGAGAQSAGSGAAVAKGAPGTKAATAMTAARGDKADSGTGTKTGTARPGGGTAKPGMSAAAAAAAAKGKATAAGQAPAKGGSRTTLITDALPAAPGTTGGAGAPSGSLKSPPRKRMEASQGLDQGAKGSPLGVAERAEGAGVEGVEGVDYIRSWTGRCYPMDRCYQLGDVRVNEISPEDADGEFEVDWIVDEIKNRGAIHYLVKWKGYELNPGDGKAQKGDWEPRKNVQSTEAFKEWQMGKPDYFLAVPVPGPSAKGKSTPKAKRPRDANV